MSPSDEKAMLKALKKLPIEEKLKLLSDADKQYLAGFIDHALRSSKSQKVQCENE